MNTATATHADSFHRICGAGAALILAVVIGSALQGGQPVGVDIQRLAAQASQRIATTEPATGNPTSFYAAAAWDEAIARGF